MSKEGDSIDRQIDSLFGSSLSFPAKNAGEKAEKTKILNGKLLTIYNIVNYIIYMLHSYRKMERKCLITALILPCIHV